MTDNAFTRAKELVSKQAEDEGLWFIAETAPEAYLQTALRALHAVIEDQQPDDAAMKYLKAVIAEATTTGGE